MVAFHTDFAGFVRHAKVTPVLNTEIQHGLMPGKPNGIIVHQTGAATAASTLRSYQAKGANGAHFLIDKDGTIYQTASVFWVTHHVGYLKPRCRVEMRCTPAEARELAGKRPGKEIGRVEGAKAWPDRYPGNSDSIGIEFVGAAVPKPGGSADEFEYEAVTAAQQDAFLWLLYGLLNQLEIDATEVFRHPDVSWKQPSEAASATWR